MACIFLQIYSMAYCIFVKMYLSQVLELFVEHHRVKELSSKAQYFLMVVFFNGVSEAKLFSKYLIKLSSPTSVCSMVLAALSLTLITFFKVCAQSKT